MSDAVATHNPKIALVGPIAEESLPARGGYQACNRRTISAMRLAGVDVVAISYPHPSTSGWKKLLGYGIGFVRLFLKVGKLRGRAVHVTGLYKQFIYLEAILVALAKLRGLTVVYDIRAGSMMRYYAEFSAMYRFVFRSVLKASDRIMVEGKEYCDFIELITGTPPYYFPNHVPISDVAAGHSGATRCDDEIGLVYVGRIVEDKGIEVVLEAASILRSRGIRTKVSIAGEGDIHYLEYLKTRYTGDANHWLGALPPEEVFSLFSRGHFFLFPTRHNGEGHSNALTEAMAAGCVPIVSRNGFNASVVGDCGKVLSIDATSSDYAAAVMESGIGDRWGSLSQKCAERASSSFDSRIVIGALLGEYAKLNGRSSCD